MQDELVGVVGVFVGDYLGRQWLSGHSELSCLEFDPIKKPKKGELAEAEKAFNRELSRRRIVIENINAEIKVFKIMTHPYRNRRKTHLLRTRLVCAILNAEKAT